MLTLTGLRNLAILGSLLAKPVLSAPHTARQSSLESYLEAQEPISIQGVIDNIGGFGTKVDGASEGVVVASPSKSDPDCMFPVCVNIVTPCVLMFLYRLRHMDTRCCLDH